MRLNRYKMGLNQDRSNTKIIGGGGGEDWKKCRLQWLTDGENFRF